MCFQSLHSLQDFLKACYKEDDFPLRSPPQDFANSVATMSKQVKVRQSAKDLKPLLQSGASSAGGDPMVNMNNQMMSLLLEKAKALDELHKTLALDKAKETSQLAKLCSTQTLSGDSEALCSPKALPLPLEDGEALEKPATELAPANDQSLGEKENDALSAKHKSLEEYEEEAMQMLCERKAQEMDKVVKGKCLKRPACSKPKAAPKKKGGQKPSPDWMKGIYGCLRCRGNVNGCSTCWNEAFQGLRFSSRAEWAAFMKQKSAKGKKGK